MNILHVLSMIPIGGVGAYLKNIYGSIDKKAFNFEFLICSDKHDGAFVKYFLDNGCEINFVPSLKVTNFPAILKAMNKFFKSQNYDIVEIHAINVAFLCQKVIKNLTNAKIIYHAHSTKYSQSRIKSIRNYLLSINIEKYGDAFFACSEEAYSSLFGKRRIEESKKFVITNPIQYVDDSNISDKVILSEFNISVKDKIVLSVGNLVKAKNYFRLLDIFKVAKALDNNLRYFIVGDGTLKYELIDYCKKNDIHSVEFLGYRQDVYNILRASHIMLNASIFEGLNISVVEAQMFGLPVIMSDTLPGVVAYNSNAIRLSLGDSNLVWANALVDNIDNKIGNTNNFKNSCFNIAEQIKLLEDEYKELL